MKIIISLGDPNGIGLEVFHKAVFSMLDDDDRYRNCEISLAGNKATIDDYYKKNKYPAEFGGGNIIIGGRECKIIECGDFSPVRFGEVSKKAGALAAAAIETSVEIALSGEFDAMVTMPVAKESLYLAGWNYPGHTEMLADRCGIEKPLMILTSGQIRVALETIHIPLREVPDSITTESLRKTIRIFNTSLKKDFGHQKPAIAMLGLNPHAGESGNIGREEIETLKPAIDKSCLDEINIQGPFPADGFFAHGDYRFFNGILAMYHDQGLAPLKLLAKGAGVNYTAGLPIVRTSPDHGTAFSIAGHDRADEQSALQAIDLAITIAGNRKKSK